MLKQYKYLPNLILANKKASQREAATNQIPLTIKPYPMRVSYKKSIY
jgi:hypothetical protein